MLDEFARQRFRLGVIAGFTYASEQVNAYIADPDHSDLIVKVGDDVENLRTFSAEASTASSPIASSPQRSLGVSK
jgi:hypothetical protein